MLRFLESPTRGVYCGDDMGLGKSCQAIAAINSLNLTTPTLIVCPAVMRHTWLNELKTWSLKSHFQAVFSFKDLPHPDRIKKLDYLVVSYDLATKAADTLAQVRWGALVLDESHALVNRDAKRTKAVLTKLWPKATYKIALSGTPIINDVTGLYPLASKFLPDQWPRFLDFAGRYAYSRPTPFGIKWQGLRRDMAPELSGIMRQNFFFRRRKEEVLQELPDKVFKKVVLGQEYAVNGSHVPANGTLPTQLDMEIAAMLARLESNEKIPLISSTLQGYRRMQGEAKAPAAIEYAKTFLEQNIPVIIFCYHRNVIEMIRAGLVTHRPAIIQGGMKPSAINAAVTDFQSGKTNLFIGQYTAAGVGITLTRSSDCILAELDWSAASVSQACSRAHRIGQKNCVTIHYLVVADSIDDKLVSTIIRKTRETRAVIEE